MIYFYEKRKLLMSMKMSEISYENYYKLVDVNKRMSKLYLKGNCSVRKFAFNIRTFYATQKVLHS